MKPAGSPNDPITPHLFREGFPVLAPYVRNIINDNLRTGTVPTYFNHAGVTLGVGDRIKSTLPQGSISLTHLQWEEVLSSFSAENECMNE